MQLYPWQSPRHEGCNDKERKNPAVKRQIKKATQALRKKLKSNRKGKDKCLSLSCV
jgi:hypothetical protein